MLTEHTGCMQVVTTTQDRSAWMDTTGRGLVRSMLHNSFSDGTSNLIGLHNAYLARIIAGTIKRPNYFWSFAGDGGFTIGAGQIANFFQQGWGLLIIYDNRRYANTGAQVSATSWAFENLATTPFGESISGNQFFPRDIVRIAAAHDVPFAATASVAYPDDLMDKVRYAINVPGPTVIWVDAPCPKEQGFGEDYTLEVAGMAVETGLFPLLRFQNGQWAIDHLRMRERIDEGMPLEEFFRMQAKAEPLSRPESSGLIRILQEEVDRRYAWFLEQAGYENVSDSERKSEEPIVRLREGVKEPSLYLADGEEMPVRTLEEF
jgi:pyruvate ferredoxin oxidoreductase beta subunit